MSATIVTLDGFDFRDMEVPERIPFGGSQRLSIKPLPGGARVIDAMGPEEDALQWEGRFRGPEAVTRAKLIDAKRRAGRAVTLTWGEMAFSGVIAEFKADYEARNEIPYRITFEVTEDEGSPATDATEVGVDEMVLADMLAAQDLRGRIGDATLGGLMDTLQGAVEAVGSFATAGPLAIQSVLSPLAAVQGRAEELFDIAQEVVGSVGVIGGIVPGLRNSQMISNLQGQIFAMQDSANLWDLRSITGRMGINLQAIGTSGSEFVTAGADLYQLATRAYGDPTEWVTIAKANGLIDPIVPGIQTLLIPPTAPGSGGVYGAE